MISWTRVVSRTASRCIRAAKRRTASGSSAASVTASASRRERADRGLELVAHVRDEVAADLLDPAGLGAVLDQDAGRGRCRGEPPGRGRSRGPPERAARELQLLPRAPAPSRRASATISRSSACARSCAADEAERVAQPGVALTTAVAGVEDDGRGAQHGQDAADTGGQRRGPGAPREARPLALARTERQHGEGADDEAGEPRQHRRPRHAHAARVSGREPPTVRCRATCAEMPSRGVHLECPPTFTASLRRFVRHRPRDAERPDTERTDVKERAAHAGAVPRGAGRPVASGWSR